MPISISPRPSISLSPSNAREKVAYHCKHHGAIVPSKSLHNPPTHITAKHDGYTCYWQKDSRNRPYCQHPLVLIFAHHPGDVIVSFLTGKQLCGEMRTFKNRMCSASGHGVWEATTSRRSRAFGASGAILVSQRQVMKSPKRIVQSDRQKMAQDRRFRE